MMFYDSEHYEILQSMMFPEGQQTTSANCLMKAMPVQREALLTCKINISLLPWT
jgi:hypothetical protein